jgi:YHS domain-containing protein
MDVECPVMKPAILAALCAAFALGCAGEPAPAPEAEAAPAAAAAEFNSTEEAARVFVNAGGRALCPIMNVVIASVEDAVGHADIEGVRYYFCCEACLKTAKENPSIVMQTASDIEGAGPGPAPSS